MAGEQKPKSASAGVRKPGERATAVLVPQGVLAGQPDVPLNRPVTTVGSNDNARLHLVSRTVSKGHAIFVNSGGVTYVADLASRTGVLVNGKLIRDVDLKTGDRVQIGKFVFRYRSAAGAAAVVPAQMPPAASVIVVGSPAQQIGGRVFQIGRRENSDVSFATDSAVSAGHAVIFEMDGQWYIRDLGSRTGTLVNNKAIHQQVLNFGDRIAIGSSTILFQPGVTAADEAAQPEIEPNVEPEATADLADEPLEIETEEPSQDQTPAHRPPLPTLHSTDDAIPLADDEPLAAVDWKSAFPPADPQDTEDEISNPLEELAGVSETPAETSGETSEDLNAIEPECTAEGSATESTAGEPEPVLHEQALDEQALDEQALDEQVLDEQVLDPILSEPGIVDEDELVETLPLPLELEPEPVAVEETVEPIAIDPEPVVAANVSEIPAIEPEPVVAESSPPPSPPHPAALPKPPSVPPPAPLAPVADHDTPVEDFIFIPVDEPVDPNAVPDLIFWGDESARPAAPLAEVPRVTQPADQVEETSEPQPASLPQPQLQPQLVAVDLLEVEAVEPPAEVAAGSIEAENTELENTRQEPQSMADAIAEAQQLLAETYSAPTEHGSAEFTELDHAPTEALLAGSTEIGDQILAEITLSEPASPQAMNVDAQTIPPVTADLQPAVAVDAAVHLVDVPATSGSTFTGVISSQILSESAGTEMIPDVDLDAMPVIDAPVASTATINAAPVEIEPTVDTSVTFPDAVPSEISVDPQPPPLEVSADAVDEIAVDGPAAEIPTELQAVEEPEFDFTAEELAAESAARADAGTEAGEPDVSLEVQLGEAGDAPLDPLSDSFPLVEAEEDRFTMSEEIAAASQPPIQELPPKPSPDADVSPDATPYTIPYTTPDVTPDVTPEDSNDADLEFLDFGDDVAAAEQPEPLPPAPEKTADPQTPATGPSIFGFHKQVPV